jgi:hypothetical protein
MENFILHWCKRRVTFSTGLFSLYIADVLSDPIQKLELMLTAFDFRHVSKLRGGTGHLNARRQKY